MAGIGMGLFFAPIANVVLSAVRADRGRPGVGRHEHDPRDRRRVRGGGPRQRLLVGRLVRSRRPTFVDGLVPAVWVGAAIVAVGRRRGARAAGPDPPSSGRADRGGRGAGRRLRAADRRPADAAPGVGRPTGSNRRATSRAGGLGAMRRLASLRRVRSSRRPVPPSAAALADRRVGRALARAVRRSSTNIRSVAAVSASASVPSPAELAQPIARWSATAPASSQSSHARRTRST